MSSPDDVFEVIDDETLGDSEHSDAVTDDVTLGGELDEIGDENHSEE